MDMEDDFLYDDEDSGHEIEDEDEDFIGMEMEAEPSSTPDKRDAEDYPCEVLTPEQIVQHMVDCIKEVNAIVEVGATSAADFVSCRIPVGPQVHSHHCLCRFQRLQREFC